jgi:hypothetical protein
MADPKLIDALSNASSLELFELGTIIDRLLADPRRVIAVRSKLHLGQNVRFMDWRTGQMRTGKLMAIKDTQVTVQEDATRTHWKLSYAGIEPGADTEGLEDPAAASQPLQQPKAGRNDFRTGEKVAFTDRYLQPQVGTIVRINQRTASVDCGDTNWRVPFAMLRQVVDI